MKVANKISMAGFDHALLSIISSATASKGDLYSNQYLFDVTQCSRGAHGGNCLGVQMSITANIHAKINNGNEACIRQLQSRVTIKYQIFDILEAVNAFLHIYFHY